VLPLDRPLLDEITLAAAGVALIALILGLVALVKLRGLRRSFRTLEGPEGRETVLEAIRRVQADTAGLRTEVAQARGLLHTTRSELADALRHVAVVRYDAFGDMGGRMSFTAALLDDDGDGLVISAINGRTEGRSYAKGVKAGRSDATLSPEEQQAISLALRGAGATPPPAEASVRRVPSGSGDAARS
jgi:hypothetical protein